MVCDISLMLSFFCGTGLELLHGENCCEKHTVQKQEQSAIPGPDWFETHGAQHASWGALLPSCQDYFSFFSLRNQIAEVSSFSVFARAYGVLVRMSSAGHQQVASNVIFVLH